MPEKRSIGEILRDAEAGRLENVFADEREPYDLVGSAERLFDLLDERGVAYVLVGGMAMLQYVDGRNTRDVDLIVEPETTQLISELVVTSEDKDFARADFSGVQLDLLKTSNSIFNLVRNEYAMNVTFGARTIECATPEGLVLLKLYAIPSLYRQGAIARADIYEGDILALFRAYPIDEASLIATLQEEMLATDIAAIREIVRDVRNRIARSTEHGTQFGAPKIQNPK